jgi:hypothetical protein
MTMIEWAAAGFLVLVYGGSGIIELPMWRRFADRFVRLGYPRSWAIVTPALKLLGAALTLIPQAMPIGASRCALIGLAAAASVLRARERSMCAPALAVMVITIASAAFLILQQWKR